MKLLVQIYIYILLNDTGLEQSEFLTTSHDQKVF